MNLTQKNLQDTMKMNNGLSIPCIGYGTWKTDDGETAEQAVRDAIVNGYRHIDTAAAYGNEKSVGAGIAAGIAAAGISRSDLFVTSKLWNSERGYDRTLKAFDQTMKDLKLDYLDLYLIHWPQKKEVGVDWEGINLDTWRAMEKLVKDGRIKSIGVSNFYPHHLQTLLDKGEIMPVIDQLESHPGFYQKETIDFCQANDILVEAWSPLGSGAVLRSEFLANIGKKYGKSVAQICIRWNLQHGILPLPKSLNSQRMQANADVFDFCISDEDMKALDEMPQLGWSGLNADKVDF